MTNSSLDIESLRKTFRDRGMICLRGFLPTEKVAKAQQAVRERISAAGIWQDDGWQAEHLRNEPINAGAKFAKNLKGCEAFNDLVRDEIPSVVAQLLDDRPTFVGMKVPQPLFTLPNADTWHVPHDVWHLDVPRFPNCGIPGLQIFTFLETVSPTGGGTLIVAGSHRMLNDVNERVSSKDVKRRLKKLPYFRDLMSKTFADRERFMQQPGSCGDVELQVAELHGEPGDVYFVDLRTFHTPAPNATSIPRIMLTRRYFLESIREQMYAASK